MPPNSSWSEVLSTTMYNRSRKVADAVSKNNALLARLRAKGKIQPFDGGVSIVETVMYAENPNTGWYSGYDLLPMAASDVLTGAEFGIKQLASPVVISGLEELQNSGKEKIFDLLEQRVENAEITMKNWIAEGIYSDGTGAGGKQITGLDAAVPRDPTTGTYGGINRATYTWWRSQVYDPASTPTSSTIMASMTALWALCSRGGDRPDLIVMGGTLWGTLMASFQGMVQFTQTGKLGFDFPSVSWMGADVVLDGGQGGFANANDAYFLNTNYLRFRPHRDRDMVPLSPEKRAPFNQDAHGTILAWAGNLVCSAPRLQGRLIGD